MLLSYANRNHSPYINSEAFISFIEKYAQFTARGGQPEWNQWIHDTSRKIWDEIGPLIEEGKCRIITDPSGTQFYLTQFYVDLLEEAYASSDETAGIPFPSEASIKTKIPQANLRNLSVITEMVSYLDNPQTELMPVIKLIFPAGIPNALVLSTFIPRRIMEAAVLKMRAFLRIQDNKDYLQNKLIPHHPGKENQLREIFNRIMVRPFDCITSLEGGEDFSYLFWASFCGLVRNDLTKKNELNHGDLAVLQSMCIIEIINNYHRAKAFKKKEKEMALNDLGIEFDKPPYAYSMDAIAKFINSKGVPLLGLFSEADLQSWLRVKISKSSNNELPEMLLITGPMDMKWYIKKEYYFNFSVKLLTEGRPVIKKAIADRWFTKIRDFHSEPAMETDEEFEKLLRRYVNELTPELMTVLMDKKLYLVCVEMEQAQGFIPENSKFFAPGGVLLPMSTLLLLKRREMIAEAKMLLPFWYSFSFIIVIMTIYNNIKNFRLEKVITKEKAYKTVGTETPVEEKSQEQAIRDAGWQIESEMVPAGDTIDTCLEGLEGRWNTLLKQQAREDLLTDVNTLIRDRLRQTLHGQRHIIPTRDSMEKLALRTASENPTLRNLNNQDSLRKYMVLYMVKLIISSNF
jgi:hypothetical protein